jgi:polyisoprenoid-binding protein YceI
MPESRQLMCEGARCGAIAGGRVVAASARTVMPRERWTFDLAHSTLGFHVRHLMISNVYGRFERWDGTLELDPADPLGASVEVRIAAASIDTREVERDAHLRSVEFLDVERFPDITFRSTRVERVSTNDFEVVGNLTLHGITRSVILDATRSQVVEDLHGRRRIGFAIGGHISRKDFDLMWNTVLETGNLLVGDRITFSIELEAVQAPESRQVPGHAS